MRERNEGNSEVFVQRRENARGGGGTSEETRKRLNEQLLPRRVLWQLEWFLLEIGIFAHVFGSRILEWGFGSDEKEEENDPKRLRTIRSDAK